MSGWGCPHDQNGICAKVDGRPCDPGMKGCELAGRYRFADESKNARFYERKAREANAADAANEAGDQAATESGNGGD